MITLGIFERIFGRKTEPARTAGQTFRLLNDSGYTPVFTNRMESIYEAEMIRASIDAIGRHTAKLEPQLRGSAKPDLQAHLRRAPNELQTWPQFLYQAATILYVRNTAFIVPIIDDYDDTTGITTICPERWELIEYAGEPWLRFDFGRGRKKAFELRRVGILTRFQYGSELFGDDNDKALRPTMELIELQRKTVEEGAENSANYRFTARLNNFSTDEDLSKERQRFDQYNFRRGGGVLIFPHEYEEIKQVTPQTYAIDAEQARLIKENVFDYFGTNADIIQNKAIGDAWTAFYEGCIEWVGLNLSETLTKMLFSERERALGSMIFFASNRLQYMSNADKLSVAAQMADRGLMTRNELRAIFNLSPLPDPLGDQIPARGEYYDVTAEPAQNGGE